MKKIKLLLFGIVVFLGIGFSSSFYVDLTSVNPVGGSVYNVLGFVSAHRLLYYNNGNWPSVNQSGVYNTSLTGFSSTNNNSFILNDSIYLNEVSHGSGNLFLVFNDGTNFGFGNSYSSSLSDYSSINTIGGIRLIFNTPVGSIGNNPILNFNISNLNDVSNLPVVGYESYSSRTVLTNLGPIIDYGTQGIKGKHFGLDSWGYSYGVNFSSDSSQISWDSFSFSSIGSNCLKSSLDLGLATFDHLVSSNCMNLGILVLKNNGYDFNAGGQGKYLLLSKNPDSVSNLLYEVLDCNSYDNMDWLPNLMDSNNCVSLQHGTIDGVLPFIDSSTSVSISSLNGFFGSIFNSSLYGFASFDDYGLTFLDFRYGDCYNGLYWDYCIGPTNSFSKLSFNPSTSIPSIKEIYISNGGQVGPGGNGNQPTFSGSVFLNNCVDTQVCYNITGENDEVLRVCTTKCINTGSIVSGSYLGSDGTYYFVNSPISIEDSLKSDNPENMFTGSYIDSGGILSLSYFTDYFQPGAKKVGVCPFQYFEGPLDFMTKLKVGDVYLLMPILCFYSAFQQGKNVTFFDDFDINDGLFSQPLIYGDTKNHKTLFAFFDVLFSIGLLGLIRYLSRHLF